ncbi:MAG: bifunctional nuclease family protein [Candidatus Nanopelagicales bacterium]
MATPEGYAPVEVVGVRVEMPTNQPILLLRESVSGLHVPIWIGASEAAAIAMGLQGVIPARPLTHDLMLGMLDELGVQLRQVLVSELADEVFYAVLDFGEHQVSARPSDAIALAVRRDVPVFVALEVLAQAGVEVVEPEQREVERFREFLDTVNPEDFE